MEEQDSMNFSDWWNSLTVSDVTSMFTLIFFIILILIFVLRTFRNKPSA